MAAITEIRIIILKDCKTPKYTLGQVQKIIKTVQMFWDTYIILTKYNSLWLEI